MRGRSVRFYATRTDIEPVLREVEAKIPVVYVEAGLFTDAEAQVFSTGLDLPDLGQCHSPESVQGRSWFMIPADQEPRRRIVPQRRGGVRYSMDPQQCPMFVVFRPGGVHQDRAIIEGSATTGAQDDFSLALMKCFALAVKRWFQRSGAAGWLGTEAAQLGRTGWRLTQDLRDPPERDALPPAQRREDAT